MAPRTTRCEHPGPRGPRGRPQAARHVHRFDRCARPASPRLGGRRQLDRRGDGRPGDDDPRHDHARTAWSPSSTTGAASRSGSTRQARTPSRSCIRCSTPAASSAAAATRSPAVCTAWGSASSTRCRRGCASNRHATALSGRRNTSAASRPDRSRRSARKAAAAGRRPASSPTPRCSRRPSTRSSSISQRLRESAYLTKRVWITLIDERNDRERSFYFEGGLQSFVRHLNRNKEVLHTRPIYVERREGGDRRRSRPPVQRLLHGERARVRQQHQHRRWRHARHGLPRGADQLAERLGASSRRPPGRRRQPVGRRRPGGPDRGHQRQADRPAVRGPDQGQARQCRGQGPGPGRRRRQPRPVPRREPGRRPADHREVPDRGARPRGSTQGARPGHPQGRARRHVAAGQAGRLPGTRSRSERALPRRGRFGRWLGQAGPRPPEPGDPAASGEAAQRREGAPRQDPVERERPAADHRARCRDRRELRPR